MTMRVDIQYNAINSMSIMMKEQFIYYLKYSNEKCTSSIEIGSGKYMNTKMNIRIDFLVSDLLYSTEDRTSVIYKNGVATPVLPSNFAFLYLQFHYYTTSKFLVKKKSKLKIIKRNYVF
ncbi:hypothetical protein RF11_03032 [Thelohanellus kitauei]|uniref:Uncharacterized protein n=1 Tax=Thelohanellus kitauei TaxID=669202 RepID=A0A0C2N4J9_THEKT|nr:hypothetical protein RF11_03032 [Thelohanellus kitauei]